MSKRTNSEAGALSIYEDYEACITVASREECDVLQAKCRVEEENCFDMGDDDRHTRFDTMKYSDLAKCFEKMDLPPEIKMEIARGCYAAYLDGYKGRAFKPHISCKVLSTEGGADGK